MIRGCIAAGRKKILSQVTTVAESIKMLVVLSDPVTSRVITRGCIAGRARASDKFIGTRCNQASYPIALQPTTMAYLRPITDKEMAWLY